MTQTNFAALTTEQKTTWSRDLWKAARNNSFVMRFTGKGPNSPFQRITELTKSERGDQAVITLVTDLTGDGVMGDTQLEDSEEEIKAYDQVITIDQIRNANRTTGRMADQKSIVNFRETSRDVLGYWLGDRVDQMAFLTLSGVAYTLHNNGATRPVLAAGKNLGDLAYAADVTAPSTNRHRRWTAAGLLAGDTTADDMTTPSYEMLVEAKAYAKTHYVRGIKAAGNDELYHIFMTPQGVAKLKLDPDFLASAQNAQARSGKNSIWSGSIPTVDGLVIHEHRHVFNTVGAAGGSKWGSVGNTNGQRVLMIGAQALGIADLGVPYWNEDKFDYDNQLGISVGKILGFKKPVWQSIYDAGAEDFGVLCIDTTI